MLLSSKDLVSFFIKSSASLVLNIKGMSCLKVMVLLSDTYQGEASTQNIFLGTPMPEREIFSAATSKAFVVRFINFFVSNFSSGFMGSLTEKTILGIPDSRIQKSAPHTEEEPI